MCPYTPCINYSPTPTLLSNKLNRKTPFFCCCCFFGFNIIFKNFSVIPRRCLVATGSSVLIFIVLPHWSIMLQTLDMIPHPVTVLALPCKWVPSEEQLVPFLMTLVCRSLGSNLWPPVPRSGHSTYWATAASFWKVAIVLQFSNSVECFCSLLTQKLSSISVI